MDLPFTTLGIETKGYRLTKKKLIAWNNENTPHVVPLFTNGGVFTSKGNGIYESIEFKFYSVDEFWEYARNFKNIVMWEG